MIYKKEYKKKTCIKAEKETAHQGTLPLINQFPFPGGQTDDACDNLDDTTTYSVTLCMESCRGIVSVTS